MRIAKVTNINATIDQLKEEVYGYMGQIYTVGFHNTNFS